MPSLADQASAMPAAAGGGDSSAILRLLQQQYGTSIAGQYTWQRYSYYDYVTLPNAGTNNVTFFNNIAGSTDPVSLLQKTLEDTNLPIANQLGNPFILRRIRCHIAPNPKARQVVSQVSGDTQLASADIVGLAPLLANLAGNGVLDISYGQTRLQRINKPFISCPPCGGTEVQSLGTGTGVAQWSNQWFQQSNDQGDGYILDPIMFIEASQIMTAAISFPLNNTPTLNITIGGTPRAFSVKVGLWFDGYLIRNRQ